tara:strand:- start:632 stop:1507 length:876 start_codon:yes stop_codon:yes gene_type:complete
MNVDEAKLLLEVDKPLCSDNIRRQYRRAALRCHPDKGGCAESFRRVCTAHDVLQNAVGVKETAERDYSSLVREVLGSVFVPSAGSRSIVDLLCDIATGCRRAAGTVAAIRDLDGPACSRALAFLERHASLLRIQPSSIRDLRRELKSRSQSPAPPTYVIHAHLEQMLEGRIYKLQHGGEEFMVPLWHEQLVFPAADGEISVRCEPTLPDGAYMDEYNDLHVPVAAAAGTVLAEGSLVVSIPGTRLEVPAQRLRLEEKQSYRLRGVGCPRIDIKDVYNDTVKADVVAHITLR